MHVARICSSSELQVTTLVTNSPIMAGLYSSVGSPPPGTPGKGIACVLSFWMKPLSDVPQADVAGDGLQVGGAVGVDIAEPVYVAAQRLDRQLEFGLQPTLSLMDFFTGHGARLYRRAAPRPGSVDFVHRSQVALQHVARRVHLAFESVGGRMDGILINKWHNGFSLFFRSRRKFVCWLEFMGAQRARRALNFRIVPPVRRWASGQLQGAGRGAHTLPGGA